MRTSSEGNIGKEGHSLKDKMLPTWEGSERQGSMAGRLAAEGVKEMGEGAGHREYWSSGQPTVCDCWAVSGRAQYGSWKKLMRETIWYQPGLCAK